MYGSEVRKAGSGLVLAVGVLMCLAGCGRSEGGPLETPQDRGNAQASDAEGSGTNAILHLSPESARYIGVETVGSKPDPLPLRLPARLEFKDGALSEVGAPMAGRVSGVLVHTGDRVKAGDPLVELSCPDAASARTTLATAEAALREAKAGLDRQDRMMEQGVGIARDRLEAEVHLEEQQAELDRARATVAFVGEGQGAAVFVRAPIPGIVLNIKATRGATVAPGGDALVEVGDPAQLWVVADVPERELPQIVDGSQGQLDLTSLADPLQAKVISIGAVVSSGLRTAPVRMTLESRPEGLRPGMYGWVRLQGNDSTMTLPVQAVLIKDGKDSVVYVAKDEQTFERRVVTVGRPLDGRVPVVSGLQAGERVVVRGALLLDGSGEQLL
jgi:cobalt-zinc-cadmium efflux system membrane fusion protein